MVKFVNTEKNTEPVYPLALKVWLAI